ncbi:heparan-alpha-glucosaminide N-acetyltransferase-like isoform X2 [Salvia hispanica]|uniref:heparan-alpha-glucosaminide N-acetyltransferase-like isoform X2 n=1 Tax=Salvia hispanica TaxID=49212 RepID=UPI0020092C71|nr:heparan-alpha-glucosaminide N-acetyltransferase-like isoform X2 [Salvia hispanica]
MASITDAGGDRTPLLHDSNMEYSGGEAENTIPPTPMISTNPKQRLVSLDVFRGLTVALMILVDDAGGAFPSINHAPWFGLTLADFVMPFFLFGVGVSVSLVFKKVENRLEATKRVMERSIKLFLLGIILQGGYFHGRGDLTYGIDLEKIRVMGVLQRIAIGYMLASVLEIWLVNNTAVNSAITFVKRYSYQIVAGILVGVMYLGLLYGLYVPDWNFDASSLRMTQRTLLGANSQTVYCGIRGSLEPPCTAVGFIDRVILGENHLYQRPVYRRTKECSVNSPDYGLPPPNSPSWCLAPFDPEGILRPGLHHILVSIIFLQDQKQRIVIWFVSSLPLLMLGYLLSVTGVPLSKPLYTLSYMFVTAGASGVLLTVIYFIVDTRCIRKPTLLFQWMGMNALVVYALAACEIFPAAVQGVYWRSPENNLVDFSERLLQWVFHSDKWGTLIFVFVEILFWGFAAGFLHFKRVYIKF